MNIRKEDRVKTLARSFLRKVNSYKAISRAALAMKNKGMLPPFIWRRLPYEGVFDVVLPDGKHFKYHSVPEDGIGRLLYWGGVELYECETVKAFYALAKDSIFTIDIGANTGLYTLIACSARDDSKVVSIEPEANSHELLMRNIALNGWLDRCRAIKAAASDHSGQEILYNVTGSVTVTATLSPQEGAMSLCAETKVNVITVDEIVEELGGIDLAKIDVEGYEDTVLRGMDRSMSKYKPALIIECIPESPVRGIERILSEKGYLFFHLTDKGASAKNEMVPDPNKIFRNYLCLHRERAGRLDQMESRMRDWR